MDEKYPTLAAAVCAISDTNEALSLLQREAEQLSEITSPEIDAQEYIGKLMLDLALAVNPEHSQIWAQADMIINHRSQPSRDCKTHSSNQTPAFKPLNETTS